MTKASSSTKSSSKAKTVPQTLTAPDAVANPFKQALQQIAARGTKTASDASKAVDKATHVPSVGNIAPVGVATRNAGKANHHPWI